MNIPITITNYTPTQATESSIGYDLRAVAKEVTSTYIEYDTGVSLALPEGVACLVLPRSSITNRGLVLGNSVGLIDRDYRGTIKMRFYTTDLNAKLYEIGDTIGQMMFIPYYNVEFNITTTLPETVRGSGGFGSTNN